MVILEDVDADWFRGQLRGKEGIFPKTFVELSAPLRTPVESLAAAPASDVATVAQEQDAAASSSARHVAVIADFEAAQPGDLNIRVGDMVRFNALW